MHRIDNSTAATVLPASGAAGPNPNGFWTSGNPVSGIPATVMDQDYFNMHQEELCHVVESAGLALTKGSYTQLLAALQALFAPNAAVNGSISLAGGRILKYGTGTTATGYIDAVNFAAAFPNNAFVAYADENSAGGWGPSTGAPQPTVYGTSNLTTSGFKVSCAKWNGTNFAYTGGTGYAWWALGD